MITFLVDENQWMDARELHVGDSIEAELRVGFQDVYNWNYPMKSRENGKRLLQVKDEFTYFCGEMLESSFHAYGNNSPHPFTGKIGAELLLDCGTPIRVVGLISEDEKTKAEAEKFLEGLGSLWGDISFSTSNLTRRTVTGTVKLIRDLTIPLSTRKLVLKLMSLDPTEGKPLSLRLSRS